MQGGEEDPTASAALHQGAKYAHHGHRRKWRPHLYFLSDARPHIRGSIGPPGV